MGTKNNPGAYDCYANAEPDEPMFVLLARDPLAPDLVLAWAEKRAETRGRDAKVYEAIDCAKAMLAWQREHVEQQPALPSIKTLSDAVREVMTDDAWRAGYTLGVTAGDVLGEIRRRRPTYFPYVDVLDVHDEMSALYGPPRR